MTKHELLIAAIMFGLTWAGIVKAEDQPIKQQTKPTIVLVHGAWADSSSWNGVVDLLLKDGYDRPSPAEYSARTLRRRRGHLNISQIRRRPRCSGGPFIWRLGDKRCFRQRPEREDVGVRRCVRARRGGIDSVGTRERSAAARRISRLRCPSRHRRQWSRPVRQFQILRSGVCVCGTGGCRGAVSR